MKGGALKVNIADVLSGDPWGWPVLTDEQFTELVRLQSNDKEYEQLLFQYFAVQYCNGLKGEIEKTGSGFAVLAAVRKCGERGLPMPIWLSYAFNQRYDAVLNFRATSWDDPLSFGKPYPKGTNRQARRKARMLRFGVLNAVNDILDAKPDTPINDDLFNRVGKALNIGRTLAAELYSEAKSLCNAAPSVAGSKVHRIKR